MVRCADSGERSIERVVRQLLALLSCGGIAHFLVSVGTASPPTTDAATMVLATLDPPANGNHPAIDAPAASYLSWF